MSFNVEPRKYVVQFFGNMENECQFKIVEQKIALHLFRMKIHQIPQRPLFCFPLLKITLFQFTAHGCSEIYAKCLICYSNCDELLPHQKERNQILHFFSAELQNKYTSQQITLVSINSSSKLVFTAAAKKCLLIFRAGNLHLNIGIPS